MIRSSPLLWLARLKPFGQMVSGEALAAPKLRLMRCVRFVFNAACQKQDKDAGLGAVL